MKLLMAGSILAAHKCSSSFLLHAGIFTLVSIRCFHVPGPIQLLIRANKRMISDETIQQQKSIHPQPRPLQHSVSELLLRQAVLDLSASESLRTIHLSMLQSALQYRQSTDAP